LGTLLSVENKFNNACFFQAINGSIFIKKLLLRLPVIFFGVSPPNKVLG
jgi:hypothetical protein